MVIKASINPRNWAESTINFNLNSDGNFVIGVRNMSLPDYDYGYGYGRYDRYERAAGTMNMSASLMIINVVEPSPRLVKCFQELLQLLQDI